MFLHLPIREQGQNVLFWVSMWGWVITIIISNLSFHLNTVSWKTNVYKWDMGGMRAHTTERSRDRWRQSNDLGKEKTWSVFWFIHSTILTAVLINIYSNIYSLHCFLSVASHSKRQCFPEQLKTSNKWDANFN